MKITVTIALVSCLAILLVLCVAVLISRIRDRWAQVLSDRLLSLGMLMVLALVSYILFYILLVIFR